MSSRILVAGICTAALTLVLAGCGRSNEVSVQEPAPERAPLVSLEEAVWPHDASDLEPDPAVTYGQFDNGLRYIILENDTPTGTASLRMRIDAGSLNETEDQRGLAHFLEHMAFNGSENVPEGEMIKILERYGLAFGPDTNAFTSFDQVQYQLDLPSVDDELLDTGLFLMRETAGNLTLAPDAIDKERGVIIAEERARNSFGLRRLTDLLKFLGPDTPLAERLPIGELDIIETAPPEAFRAIYDSYYRPENITLVVAGDIDTSDIETRIRANFADWQPEGAAGPPAELGSVDPNRGLDAGFFYDPDVPTFISIAKVKPPVVEPDTSETRRRNLIRSIGNNILTRRLSRLSRQEDAVFIGGSAAHSSFFNAAETATLDLTTSPENWEAALALGEQELRRALEHGFTPAELAEQIANIRTSLKNAADQAATRTSTNLAATLASAIHEQDVFTTPQSGLERFEAFAGEISVEDVHAAFRAQWEGGGGPLIHLSNNVEIDDAREKILAAWTESGSVPVTPPEAAEQAAFAYTDFGQPGEVVSDTLIEDLGIRTLVFDNNVRLNLKKTDFEDAVIRISLRIGGGLLEFPADKDGLSVFMSVAFPQGGLEAHSIDELQTILAGRSVSSGLVAGEDSFGASLATTPDDFLLQMQVLAAGLTAPGYRPEAAAQYEQLVSVFLPTLDAEPGGILQRDVDRILRSGDVRFGIGSEEALLARNFDELKPVLDRALTEGAIEIGLVGDLDEAAVIAAVAETFGALPARLADPQSFDTARNVAFPTDSSPRTLTHAGPANKALALTYWPTTDNSDQKSTYVRNLLRAVLRLKLTDTLREELGATYSPGAGSNASGTYPGYGYLSATSEVNPADIDRVFEAVADIAADMAAGGISEDELQRARQPILENIEEARETNGSWLGIVDEAQTAPEFLERWRTSPDVYQSITVEDLTAAAIRWFDPDKALQVRIVSSNAE